MIERHFHDIFYNGKSLADFGVHISGDGAFNSPEKDFETVEVPGRNGDLHIFNERFKNVDVTYKAFIIGDVSFNEADPYKDFKWKMRQLRAYLMSLNGYQRIEDTYHLDEYRMGLFKGPIETEAILLQAGEFDLTFNCMPQRFLKSGEKTYAFTTTTAIIENHTLFEAKPFVRIYGKGSLGINGCEIRIVSSYPYPYIDIDCDIQDAYYNNINCNKYITLYNGQFYKLKPGINTISTGAGITKYEITPRWWTI